MSTPTRLLLVYGHFLRVFASAVFFLFLVSSPVLAIDREADAVKALASKCTTQSAKSGTSTESGKKKSKKPKHESVTKTVALFPLRASWEAVKGSFYPMWFFGKGGLEYLSSKKEKRMDALKEVIKNRWLKDKGAMLFGAALWGLQQTTGLTANQFHKMTAEFDVDDDGKKDDGEESDAGVIVIVDNFGDDEIYPHAGEYVFNGLYKPKYGDRAILLKDVDFAEIPAALKKIAETRGPIKKLDYYGHGLVASLVGNGGDITDRVWQSRHGVAPLYERKNAEGKPIETEGSFWQNALFTSKTDPNIFARNAKIRLNSCFVGNGPDGELFVRGLANSWLRRGGTIYTSNVQILPSAGEFVGLRAHLPIVPQIIRSATDHLTPIRGAATAYTLMREIPGEIHNPDRVDGPYLLPGSRVTIHRTKGESPLRGEFEKAWAFNFQKLEKSRAYEIYGPGDIRHFAPLREGTPPKIYASLKQEIEYIADRPNEPHHVELVFQDSAKAKEYMQWVDLNSAVLEEPKYLGPSVFITPKPDVNDRIRYLEYGRLLDDAKVAKAELKSVYEKRKSEAAGDKKKLAEVETAYNEYLRMLPLYAFPFHKPIKLPRDVVLYKELDSLLKP